MPDAKARTIDVYLGSLERAQRTALEKLRKQIRSIVPEAEECISYGMPAFRVNGRIVAGFAARSSGCSYYPFSGRTLRTLAKEVAAYGRTPSALHFDTKKGLPTALVRKLVATRMAEVPAVRADRRARAASPARGNESAARRARRAVRTT